MRASQPVSSSYDEEQIIHEYEDFVYIVSHDLNAPLRHVKEFTRLLIGVRGKELNDEEAEYIHYLEKSLERIDEMQKALRALSRLHTRAQPMRALQSGLLVAQALKDLDGLINETSPVITYNDLPMVTGEESQLRLLFHHLIENALKFRDKTNFHPQIAINALDKGDHFLFTVQDNGIGIAPDYHEEVFRLFRCLNQEDYTGIGAGLTLCRKIVQRHGGEIALHSPPGQGTIVTFSLPK